MPKKNIDLSLIIACYNEEPHLFENFKKILWVLNNLKINFEIVMIDDASKDKTANVIRGIVDKYKEINIKTIFHKRNFGRGATVADGIVAGNGKIVGFLDVDLETSEQYIPIFYWKVLEGSDVAIAKRNYEFALNKIIRFVASRAYAKLVRTFLHSPFVDTEAGYKFFNREKIMPVLTTVKDKHWFWDTEIVIRSYLAGLKVIEVPVMFVRDPNKKSTVRVIPDSIEYLKKIAEFKRELARRNL